MSSSLDQAVRSSWGPVTVCPTTSIWFTHASPWRVIADDREFILCGGASPRGLSDETTSLGTMAAAMERKPTPALQHLQPGRLLLGECLSAGQQGCGPTGRTARIFGSNRISKSRPKDPKAWHSKLFNSTSNQITRDGISFQVSLLPDPSGPTRECLE